MRYVKVEIIETMMLLLQFLDISTPQKGEPEPEPKRLRLLGFYIEPKPKRLQEF